MTMPARLSSRELAFAQYVAMHGERDPLARSERVAVFIEASLTDLYKSAVLVGLRTPGVDELGRFQVLQVGGDATVAEEVIGPYWTARQQLDLLSRSSAAITPANYKFQFAGEVNTGGALAYIYDVTPKKKRPGLMAGRLWIDASTGEEVEFSGYAIDKPVAKEGRVNLVRETKLVNGFAVGRVSHVAWSAPLLGKAEVTVTEVPLNIEMTPQAHY